MLRVFLYFLHDAIFVSVSTDMINFLAGTKASLYYMHKGYAENARWVTTRCSRDVSSIEATSKDYQ